MLSSCAIRATPSLRRSLAPASNLPIHPRRRGQLVRHVCIARAWAVGREGGALVSSPPSALENDLAFDGALALVGGKEQEETGRREGGEFACTYTRKDYVVG